MPIENHTINANQALKSAMEKLEKNGRRVLFVVDNNGLFLGVLSSGDVRRWILKTGGLKGKVIDVCNKNPLTVKEDYNLNDVKSLLLKNYILAVPVVSSEKRIIKILFWEDVFKENYKHYKEILDVSVVIMAGGKGTRLSEFTKFFPKPLIPIGGKTMIELIMDEYAKFGINDFIISLGYKSKMIKAYLEDYNRDISLEYIEEEKPLGTSGSLKLINKIFKKPFFVSNCDVIIYADYADIHKFHTEGKYALTIVASMQFHKIPYGVCELEENGSLKKINEKPEFNFLVNSGMYIFNTETIDLIPDDAYFNITDLIEKLKENGMKIGVYPVSEKSYFDVGQWKEYKASIEMIKASGGLN